MSRRSNPSNRQLLTGSVQRVLGQWSGHFEGIAIVDKFARRREDEEDPYVEFFARNRATRLTFIYGVGENKKMDERRSTIKQGDGGRWARCEAKRNRSGAELRSMGARAERKKFGSLGGSGKIL